jgi:hypothetical protein
MLTTVLYMCACVRVCVRACVCACVCVCVRACTHTHTDTATNVYYSRLSQKIRCPRNSKFPNFNRSQHHSPHFLTSCHALAPSFPNNPSRLTLAFILIVCILCVCVHIYVHTHTHTHTHVYTYTRTDTQGTVVCIHRHLAYTQIRILLCTHISGIHSAAALCAKDIDACMHNIYMYIAE